VGESATPGNTAHLLSLYPCRPTPLVDQSGRMGEQTLSLRKAWTVYDRWLADPRVDFYPEPRDADAESRRVTEPFGARPASKWIGDGWLLASSNGLQSTLVTFDKALYQQGRKQGYSVVMPG